MSGHELIDKFVLKQVLCGRPLFRKSRPGFAHQGEQQLSVFALHTHLA